MNLIARHNDQLQFKIQQSINLADDEINRLKNYLLILEAKKKEAQQRIGQLKSIILKKNASAKYKKANINRSIAITKLQAEHNQILKQLYQKYQEEMNNLQLSFIKITNDNQAKWKTNVLERSIPYDNQISLLKSKHDKLIFMKTSTLDEEKKIMNDGGDVRKIQNQRIQYLEKCVSQKNIERYQNLRNAKNRLAETVSIIESHEKDYQTKIASYEKAIERLDAHYQGQLQRETNKGKQTIEFLARKVERAEKKANMYEKSIHQIEQHSKAQLSEAQKEALQQQSLQQKLSLTQSEDEKSKNDAESLQKQLNNLQDNLKSLEIKLLSLRSQNETYKREIGRIKHEQQFAPRLKVFEDK